MTKNKLPFIIVTLIESTLEVFYMLKRQLPFLWTAAFLWCARLDSNQRPSGSENCDIRRYAIMQR